jgi:lysozyme
MRLEGIIIVVVKGIDVSHHNGVLDWQKIKNSGIDFALIRTGFGKKSPNQIDRQFENNYRNAKAVGLPIGAYHYSYAYTTADAEKEAEFVIELLRGKQFEYPIYFDIEEKKHTQLSKQLCTDIVTTFCTKLEKAGYWAGIYTFDTFFKTNLDENIQKRFACAVARVDGQKPKYCKNYGIWQYSWKGKVEGSSIETDMDYCYIDYPSLIKKAKLNGYNQKLYTVSATSTGLTEFEAKQLAENLEILGMKAEVK